MPLGLMVAVAVAVAACSSGNGGGAVPTEPVVPAKAPAAAIAPAWETPEGWRTETIPFPLEFAPGLAYRGVEELRFPKAFLVPGDEWYFSYAFVWHVAAPGPASVEVLEADLVAYFRGLAIAVGGAEREDIKAFPFAAALEGDLASGTVTGTVAAFDAFKAQQGLTLQLRVRGVPCSAGQERAYVFVASPRPYGAGDLVWAELERLAAAFRCP
ncbi:MAG TPA: hypothetical protein VM261_16430 [Kofleriaceae bacterium]|nr:hypothetical protein [Kofleriaceae bacterium]